MPRDAGYEGSELWQRRSDPWLEKSAASSENSCRVWRLCGITAKGGSPLKTREVQPITVPPINADVVRETREALKMSRHVFAFKIGVNPRTLERWEQGRSKPNEQAAALIWLVRKYPDTLKRLESLAASA